MSCIILIVISTFWVLSAAQESQNTTGPTHGKVVVCPVPTESAIGIIGNNFKIDEADWNLCTHLIALDGKFLLNNEMTERNKEEDYKQLSNLRSEYPHLKIYLAGRIQEYFVDFLKVNDSTRLQEYIKGITDYLKKHHFDGLDLNCGELCTSLTKISDFDKVNLLLQHLKESFKQDDTKLLLTSSFSMSTEFLAEHIDYSAPAKHLDYFHFLPIEYDMHLLEKYNVSRTRDQLDILSVQEKIDSLIESGVPANKIVMGLTFGGVNFQSEILGDTVSKFDRINGYSAICEMITGSEADKWMFYYEDVKKLTNAYYKNGEKNKKRIIMYGESRMVANQMRFAVRRGLAGAATITVDRDDFKGICPLKNDTFYDFVPDNGIILHFLEQKESTFPLLRTVNEAITISLEELAQRSKGSASHSTVNVFYISFVLSSFVVLMNLI
ncbi:probable chitinase 2 [Sitodiplosis mosellana]|uniref:probable chitinase 2 n=1 Tax=Sitodiplosis mosellana TaxID=263140 RepID=UPI002444B65B|nr:probable chitinase 2 [Sitodiplosis mosellana]